MTERQILFSGPMVRAILDGRKTQTRRVCKGQRELSNVHDFQLDRCPFGQPGDRLWVRESARVIAKRHHEVEIEYVVDGERRTVEYPSRLAPAPLGKCLANGTYREASRITLEITGVRVERLQEISNEDIRAEGACTRASVTHRVDFQSLWESVYGAESWAANPWVWVVEFRRLP